ncbi:MAG: hypothetical protein ABIK62_06110, partial [candidate division WOR-3 bacterium]
LSGFGPEELAPICGVSAADLVFVGETLASSRQTLVILTTSLCRVSDPALYTLAAQLLASRLKGKNRLLLITESFAPAGQQTFAELLDRIAKGSVRVHFDFGRENPNDLTNLLDNSPNIKLR